MISTNTKNLLLWCAALGMAASVSTGCTVKDQPNYLIAPQINHMMFSRAVESQTKTDLFKNGRSLQRPPAGTLPRGHVRTHYNVDLAAAKALGKVDESGKPDLVAVARLQALKAGEELKNPIVTEGEDGATNLARGKVVFNTFCSPCHAKDGKGQGLVVARGVGMPAFPLATKGAGPMGYKDGHIFHIITYGRGMMGSYAAQIAPEDRWKAILWLRKLQKGGAN